MRADVVRRAARHAVLKAQSPVALDWKICRRGHTGHMIKHSSKPNSLTCTVCRKLRDGKKYQEKRVALVAIYSQLLATTELIATKAGGTHLAKVEVLRTLRKKIKNLSGGEAEP